ncbi:MAG: cytochrome c biogenesis protein CcdA [Kiritimatiellia bacterium]
MKYIKTCIFSVFLAFTAVAQFGESPFSADISATGKKNGDSVDFVLRVDIPPEHVIYYDSFDVSVPDDFSIEALELPEALEKPDLLDPAQQVRVYARSFEGRYRIQAENGLVVTVSFQGCDKSVCFMPESHSFCFDKNAFSFSPCTPAEAENASALEDHPDADLWLQGGSLETAGGYMNSRDFLAFLDKAEGREAADVSGFRQFLDDPVVFLHEHGVLLTLLLVLVGGVLLNLTPCVLPMIPVNLAVIGAGTGTRTRGFVRGSAYGLGIILVYGGLGWLILRMGLFFGAIQSNPWFNLIIGVIFVVLALALFDLLVIDFTGFVTPKNADDHKKGVIAALIAGAVSALLAGACVAPVVLAVLLLAGNLYAGGMQSAQFLPFLLGAGMALPWPLAGAGLSVLPSPGMWMVRIKQLFGVFLLLLAAYYFYVAGKGFFAGSAVREGSINAGDHDAWMVKVEEARSSGKPLFVDFWATWCKNCTVMEKKTFRDEAVEKRLENYTVVKVQAEKPDESPAEEMLQAFNIRGLPGFAVLQFEER